MLRLTKDKSIYPEFVDYFIDKKNDMKFLDILSNNSLKRILGTLDIVLKKI